MTKTFQLSALRLSLCAGLAAFNANARSTIILGHNEDEAGAF